MESHSICVRNYIIQHDIWMQQEKLQKVLPINKNTLDS